MLSSRPSLISTGREHIIEPYFLQHPSYLFFITGSCQRLDARNPGRLQVACLASNYIFLPSAWQLQLEINPHPSPGFVHFQPTNQFSIANLFEAKSRRWGSSSEPTERNRFTDLSNTILWYGKDLLSSNKHGQTLFTDLLKTKLRDDDSHFLWTNRATTFSPTSWKPVWAFESHPSSARGPKLLKVNLSNTNT